MLRLRLSEEACVKLLSPLHACSKELRKNGKKTSKLKEAVLSTHQTTLAMRREPLHTVIKERES